MKKMLCLAAATLVTGAFAMDAPHWDAQMECTYRVMNTLSGGEQWALFHRLRELSGSYEDTFYRAINHASDKNGANFTTVAMVPGAGDTTTGSENQTINGMDAYAMSFRDRSRHEISDWDAYMALVHGVDGVERGVITSTWPTLPDGCQHAILTVIKRSWCIGPPTADQMNWWK